MPPPPMITLASPGSPPTASAAPIFSTGASPLLFSEEDAPTALNPRGANSASSSPYSAHFSEPASTLDFLDALHQVAAADEPTVEEAQDDDGPPGIITDNEDEEVVIPSSLDVIVNEWSVGHGWPLPNLTPRTCVEPPPVSPPHPQATTNAFLLIKEDHAYTQFPLPSAPTIELSDDDFVPTLDEILQSCVPVLRFIPKPLRKEFNQLLQGTLDNVNHNPTSNAHHLLLNAFPKCILQAPKRGGRMHFKEKQRFLKRNMKLCMARGSFWATLG